MDARVQKLMMHGLAQEHAAKLVQAGLDNPARIKAAADKDILALPGVGQSALERIRERFPKSK